MSIPTLPPVRENIGHLADAALDQYVRPHLGADDDGKYIALDVDTGAYEVDADPVVAIKRLKTNVSTDARLWLARAGYPTTCYAGGIGPTA